MCCLLLCSYIIFKMSNGVWMCFQRRVYGVIQVLNQVFNQSVGRWDECTVQAVVEELSILFFFVLPPLDLPTFEPSNAGVNVLIWGKDLYQCFCSCI